MEKFKVLKEKCIACRACERVAEENFKIIDGKAIVYKQPENETEETKSIKALKSCPTNAIEIKNIELITGSSNVKETLEKHPKLKEKLIELSPKFKKMQTPFMWNTLAKFATFENASKMTKISLCEILHTLNEELGLVKELSKKFPECIKEFNEEKFNNTDIFWDENEVLKVENNNFESIENVLNKLKNLKRGEGFVFEGEFVIDPFIKNIEELKYLYNVKKINKFEYRVSVFNKSNKDNLNILDVRTMQVDPFDVIIKKAYSIKPGEEFILVQTFEPTPLINMLNGMGFDHKTEIKSEFEVWVYFKKTIEEEEKNENSNKPTITIQSATPVGYPIIMKLLQSKKIKNAVNIKELKVWEETEKHLGWIVNGKADISFSALITASKFKGMDVKMPVVFVWDNFSILTRGYKAKSIEDLKGKKLYLPLFEDAPPAKITKYLIQSKGFDVNDFEFVFGKPFGRPKQIMNDFINGKVDTVLLREPEAGFAIKTLKNNNIKYSELSYGKLWNEINNNFGLFPNAGVIFKGEFVRKYPEISKVVLDELKNSIEWVNKNKKEAAKLSFDMMRANIENVEEFLNRVTFKYVEGEELTKKINQFYSLLIENDILNFEIDNDLMNMFKI
ncbi:hypothetical protein OSSY52_00700 [Tepiditoga spiralis]|uniref:DUF1858 domain-containing protein n=1 Tax=Tepiditoga spiralis TaxID=2108365 RepID=A0A7G1G9D0_9BACT|nr:DUF1858 domain-containing protein [Tepiditoga spiralis]BBE29929.1 hypothetical protein OSSY52_00700 [Tepiditoga spiralis]